MCGRDYRIGDKQAIAEYFDSEPAEDLPDFASSTTQPGMRISARHRRTQDGRHAIWCTGNL
jgi:hypothetical protein